MARRSRNVGGWEGNHRLMTIRSRRGVWEGRGSTPPRPSDPPSPPPPCPRLFPALSSSPWPEAMLSTASFQTQTRGEWGALSCGVCLEFPSPGAPLDIYCWRPWIKL
eukprot:2545793-Pyramimonas_sp.AAC.1